MVLKGPDRSSSRGLTDRPPHLLSLPRRHRGHRTHPPRLRSESGMSSEESEEGTPVGLCPWVCGRPWDSVG